MWQEVAGCGWVCEIGFISVRSSGTLCSNSLDFGDTFGRLSRSCCLPLTQLVLQCIQLACQTALVYSELSSFVGMFYQLSGFDTIPGSSVGFVITSANSVGFA